MKPACLRLKLTDGGANMRLSSILVAIVRHLYWMDMVHIMWNKKGRRHLAQWT